MKLALHSGVGDDSLTLGTYWARVHNSTPHPQPPARTLHAPHLLQPPQRPVRLLQQLGGLLPERLRAADRSVQLSHLLACRADLLPQVVGGVVLARALRRQQRRGLARGGGGGGGSAWERWSGGKVGEGRCDRNRWEGEV